MKKLAFILCLCAAQYGFAADAQGERSADGTNYTVDMTGQQGQISAPYARGEGRTFQDNFYGNGYNTFGAYPSSEAQDVDYSSSGSYGDDTTGYTGDYGATTSDACCTVQPSCPPPEVCYVPCVKYCPRYYYVRHCEQCPQYHYKKCCRYVPQYYQKRCCRYVPQYYCVTCCRQCPEYYNVCYCTMCPKYSYERKCTYIPQYYYKKVCKAAQPCCDQPAPCAPACPPACPTGACGTN